MVRKRDQRKRGACFTKRGQPRIPSARSLSVRPSQGPTEVAKVVSSEPAWGFRTIHPFGVAHLSARLVHMWGKLPAQLAVMSYIGEPRLSAGVSLEYHLGG